MLEQLLSRIQQSGIKKGISGYRFRGCPTTIVKSLNTLAETRKAKPVNIDEYEYVVTFKELSTINWRVWYHFPLQSWELKDDLIRN